MVARPISVACPTSEEVLPYLVFTNDEIGDRVSHLEKRRPDHSVHISLAVVIDRLLIHDLRSWSAPICVRVVVTLIIIWLIIIFSGFNIAVFEKTTFIIHYLSTVFCVSAKVFFIFITGINFWFLFIKCFRIAILELTKWIFFNSHW